MTAILAVAELRQQAAVTALASVRLEGQEPDAFTHRLTGRVTAGQLTSGEALVELDRHFGHDRRFVGDPQQSVPIVDSDATDPYVDEVTGLLRNRMGIGDAGTLAAAEAAYTQLRIYDLELRSLCGRFDLAHLCAIHGRITQDLVDWPGQVRTVNISKGGTFCFVGNIARYADQIFGRLGATDCLRGLTRTPFVQGLADLYGDLNALHPFREFNGRAQRSFMGQLAVRAGWRVAWERLDRMENDAASAASLGGDPEPLRTLVDTAVEATG